MINKFKHFYEYFKYLNNPIEVLKFKFGISDRCLVKLKDTNYSIELNTVYALDKLMGNIFIVKKESIPSFFKVIKNIDNNDKCLDIDGINFLNIYSPEFIEENDEEYYVHLIEFFMVDVLNLIEYSGRHVVDIGANIADTALFFAKEGAEVISFEPVPHLYDLAIRNIQLNPQLESKITFVNKGVGGKRGKLNIESTSTKSYVGNKTCEMEVITIEDILNDYDFVPDILKMDCEGCEFEIIQNSDLSMFNEIIFEHHAKIAKKNHEILIEKLKDQGFNIELHESAGVISGFETQGMIYAYK